MFIIIYLLYLKKLYKNVSSYKITTKKALYIKKKLKKL